MATICELMRRERASLDYLWQELELYGVGEMMGQAQAMDLQAMEQGLSF